MYCPNCGEQIATQQQFCRTCGLALDKVAQSLVEQGAFNLDRSIRERKERLEWWGLLALCVCGGGVVLTALYKIVTLLIAGKVLAGLGVLAVIVIVGCGLLAAVLFEEAKEIEAAKVKGRLQEVRHEAGEQTTTKPLPEGRMQGLPSVTERTTELLYAEKRGGATES